MSTLYVALTIVLVFVSLALIALVLLQRGKGADTGAAFGSGASGTVFGARGSTNFLSRSTALLATVFFAVCLALAYLSAQESGPSGSLLDDFEEAEPATAEPAVNDAEPELTIPDADDIDLPAVDIPDDPAPVTDDTAPGTDETATDEPSDNSN